MSLSRLHLPSNGGILEGHVDTAAKKESEDGNENLSKVSDSQAPEPAVPAIVVAQTHLMKTIDFRGNDLESEEVELFSLKVGFPDEPAVEGDNIVNVVEARPPDVAHFANRQEGEEERAPNRWLNAH
ncbi:hypothetical protein CVT26_015655 [Gymnopilus dilepis]|uniref:Uncharacterized protein n=1 Tax=Gymnopilus dilepis TaxID=231916 RepID=A0A409VFB2_9AGAR|nr:hypothetical protein CVT26_015655 [Gymnopilus dilepis]